MLPLIAAAEAQAHSRYGPWQAFGPLLSVAAGPGSPLSSAWLDGSRPPLAAELEAHEAFSRQHGQKPTLQLLSDAVPGTLPLLRARGYQLTGVLHVYAHDLQTLPDLPARPVQIRPARTPEEWAQASAEGFGGGLDVMRAVALAPGTRLLCAWLEGELAGTAALTLSRGVAALHGTSTRPGQRGHGVQTALLAHRLAQARAHGAALASVFVTPGAPSERNIMRAGFRMAGQRLTFTQPDDGCAAAPPGAE